jgi:hypothetical protein
VYRVNCKNCNKMYIGETKFKMRKRIKQQKKNIEFKKINNNAIAKHVEEEEHQID